MNRRQLITSAVPLAFAGSAAGEATRLRKSLAATTPPSLDSAAHAFLASGYGVGLSVAAIRDNKLLFATGYGTANLETATPVTAATVFRAGSITKQFTAAAVMRLVESGKLDLDAPAAKYVTEMAPAGPITVRRLLNQTSGLHNYTGPEFAQLQMIDHTPSQILEYILRQPKLNDFKPGERFEYSNSNYFVLGIIIERVSGRSLNDVMGDLIRAAGLMQTAADQSASIVPHRADGYSLLDNRAGCYQKAQYLCMDNTGAAGFLRSTPTDLAKWHQALFDNRVIRESSVWQMLETGKLNSGNAIIRENPPISQGKPVYGFGLEVGTFDGRKAIGHGGTVPGYTTYLVTFPAQRLSLAMMMNIDRNYQMPFAPILRAVLGAPSIAVT